jgi:hypothetical protein
VELISIFMRIFIWFQFYNTGGEVQGVSQNIAAHMGYKYAYSSWKSNFAEFIVCNYQYIEIVATSYTNYEILWELTSLLEIEAQI